MEANLLTQSFRLLEDAKVKVYSITFDRATSKLSMCTSLGADFKYFGSNYIF
jgi:hypothetical protein